MCKLQSRKYTSPIGYYVVIEREVVVGFPNQMEDLVRKKLIVIDLVSDSNSRVPATRLSGVCVHINEIDRCGCGVKPCRKEQGYQEERKKNFQS